MTQKQAAKLMGLTQPNVSDLLRGRLDGFTLFAGRRLTLVRLFRDEAGDVAEVLDVEGAEWSAQAQGGGGNEGVNQAEAMGEVQQAKVPDGLQAFDICRPDERQGGGEPVYGQRVLLVLRALVKFHEDMAGQGKAARWCRSVPGDSGRVLTLNVYHYVGV